MELGLSVRAVSKKTIVPIDFTQEELYPWVGPTLGGLGSESGLKTTNYIHYNNNNGRNGSFLRGWLPHRGKAQMACTVITASPRGHCSK